MQRIHRMFLAITMGLFTVGSLRATEIGDAAPPLKVVEWVKGKPVDLKAGQGKSVFVVEFWATWCGPCRATIPHLTDLQKRYENHGVVFVGVSDEPTATVKPFVEDQGDKMNYTVACDDGYATNKAYMQAFEVMGIPHAFIIDKTGAIAWHGYPADPVMEKTLEQVVAGTYDVAAARKAAAAGKLLDKYWELAVKEANYSKQMGDIGHQILTDAAHDANILNEFAWMVLTDPDIKKRDVAMGAKAAKAAFDASGGTDPLVLDTYARSLFMTDKKAEAIQIQKQALGLCTDPEMKRELQASLDEYEGRK